VFLSLVKGITKPNFIKIGGPLPSHRSFKMNIAIHIKDGADDCDRIAKTHKCGVEKDPELVANMMQLGNLQGDVVKIDIYEKILIFT